MLRPKPEVIGLAQNRLKELEDDPTNPHALEDLQTLCGTYDIDPERDLGTSAERLNQLLVRELPESETHFSAFAR